METGRTRFIFNPSFQGEAGREREYHSPLHWRIYIRRVTEAIRTFPQFDREPFRGHTTVDCPIQTYLRSTGRSRPWLRSRRTTNVGSRADDTQEERQTWSSQDPRSQSSSPANLPRGARYGKYPQVCDVAHPSNVSGG